MAEPKRWEALDKVLLISIGLMIFFAFIDSHQILTFFTINTPEAWILYGQYTAPSFWATWYVVLAIIGLIWYVIYKDKSEAVALVAATWTLLFFGTQDLFYFLFSGKAMETSMCWVNMWSIKFISNLLGEICPSPASFILSAILGIFIARYVYVKLKKAKW